VGSFREDVVEGTTGHIFRPKDVGDLARAIEEYFSSPLYRDLGARRQAIKDFANDRYSWTKVGETTERVYQALLEA
jgi:glycosyltransferase involved in cell wall biosynthesis